MFRNMMLVVLAALSLVQLVFGEAHSFEYTNCGERVVYYYSKSSPLGVQINGMLNLTYISAPMGDYIRFDAVVFNDKITEIGSSALVDDLNGLPTSDNSARIDRDEFYRSRGELPGHIFAVLPVYVDPTQERTFISIYLVSEDEVNNRPILNWAAGNEWGVDYAGQCDQFTGFYLEVMCDPIITDYCTAGKKTVTQGNYGSIGSGNSLLVELEEDLACSNKVTFANAATSDQEQIAITVYTNFEEGDSLKIYDGADNTATLLAEYSYGDAPFTQDALYTSQPDVFYLEFVTDHSNSTARGNGYSIVYERVSENSTNGEYCFAPSASCTSQCLTNLASSYALAFDYLVDPNYNFDDCLVNWDEECVLAAYTLSILGICDTPTATRSAGNTQGGAFLTQPKTVVSSNDQSRRKVHLETLASVSL